MRTLYLLISATVLTHAVFIGSRVAVSLYALHLGASAFSVGLMIALYGLVPMVLSVPAGRLTDRVGPRGPMLAGACGVVIGALLPALAPAGPWAIAALYASTTVIGCGFLVYHLALQNLAGHIGKPEDRLRNFSVLALGFSLSAMIGPAAAGFTIEGAGYRLAFLMFALMPLASVAVLAFSRLDLPQPTRVKEAGPRRMRDLLENVALRRLLVSNALIAIAWDTYMFALPMYAHSIELSASTIGLVMATFSGGALVVRVVLTRVAARLNAWRMIVAVMLSSAAVFLLFPVLPSAWWLGLLSALLGLALGVSQPLVMSLMHSASPPGRVGEAVGIRAFLINGSQAFIPLLGGAVGAALGMSVVFWATAFALGAGGIAGLRALRRG